MACEEDSDCKGIWGGSLKSTDEKLQLVCQNYGGAGPSKPKYCQIVPNPRIPTQTPYTVAERIARCKTIGLDGRPYSYLPDDYCY